MKMILWKMFMIMEFFVLKIVGFNETNENILIFEHHVNLIITNNAKSKWKIVL